MPSTRRTAPPSSPPSRRSHRPSQKKVRFEDEQAEPELEGEQAGLNKKDSYRTSHGLLAMRTQASGSGSAL